MNSFQQYLFQNVLKTMLTIVGGLVLIALLTQGLTQMDLIVENRQSALTFFYVSMLAAPQVISLLLPIALFIAAASSLNRAHRDSEIVVAQAAGMTRFQIASPILRLAILAALLQLAINLWVQPASYREMRETVTNAKSDLAASLVRPGEFNNPAENLTVYVGEALGGGELRTLLISDQRDPNSEAVYIARSGALTEVDGVPAILMRDGRVQQADPKGNVSDLTFDQYVFELGAFMKTDGGFILKSSDRYLPELFFPDMTNYYDKKNINKFLAEGHSRLAAPILNLAMAMLAVIAVLGGDFNRRGYQTRIAACTGIAITIQLLVLMSVSTGEGDPALNVIQYLTPFLAFVMLSVIFFWGRHFSRRLMARHRAKAFA